MSATGLTRRGAFGSPRITSESAVLHKHGLLLMGPAAVAGRVSRPERKYISGRNENASVGGAEGIGVWLLAGGSARGITPSLLQRISNVVEQRAEQSYPESRGGC